MSAREASVAAAFNESGHPSETSPVPNGTANLFSMSAALFTPKSIANESFGESPALPPSSPCLISDFFPKPVLNGDTRPPSARQDIMAERSIQFPAMEFTEERGVADKIEAAFGKGLESLQHLFQKEQENLRQQIAEVLRPALVLFEQNMAQAEPAKNSVSIRDLSPVAAPVGRPGSSQEVPAPRANTSPFTPKSSKATPKPSLFGALRPRAEKNVKRHSQRNDADFHLDLMNRMSMQETKLTERKKRVERILLWTHLDGFTSHALTALVKTYQFNAVCSFMMLLFALTVGVESDLDLKAALSGEQEPKWPKYANTFFNIFFGLEVGIRILGEKVDFFIGHDWRWNMFDLVLVLISLLDLIVGGLNLNFFRVLRVLKILRALKIVRVLRWFHELRVLLSTIFNSLASLCWTLLFLGIVTFLCSNAIAQGVANHMKDNYTKGASKSDIHVLIDIYFPAMSTCMYTLIGAITGGVDWMDAAHPCWKVGRLYGCIFMLFVLTSVLGILNVVTSMFVERAQSLKRSDRDFAISDELMSMRLDMKETLALFRVLDPEGTGRVTLESLLVFLQHDRIMAHFATIGIDVTDQRRIAHLLDPKDDGYISLSDFVSGVISLKGASNKADAMIALELLREILETVETLSDEVGRIRNGNTKAETSKPKNETIENSVTLVAIPSEV